MGKNAVSSQFISTTKNSTPSLTVLKDNEVKRIKWLGADYYITNYVTITLKLYNTINYIFTSVK